jgi:hypothetical protein
MNSTRIGLLAVLGLLVAMLFASLPELRRYLKIRSM